MTKQPDVPLVHPSAQIHASAILDGTTEVGAFTVVGANVALGKDCRLGPQCDIGDRSGPVAAIQIGVGTQIGGRVGIRGAVEIGDNVKIGSNVMLHGPLRIGDRTEIFDGAVIGASGQYPGRHSTGGKVVIEADVVIREFAAINQPVEGALTRIGSHSYVMARSQIDHDCEVGEHVKLATGVTLGGAVKIDDYAYLGINSVVHQGRHVGSHTMLGMNSTILKNVPPYAVVIGTSFTKINAVGLSRRGYTQQAIDEIQACYASGSYRDLASTAGPTSNSSADTIADFYFRNAGKPILSPSFSSGTLT